MMKKTIISLLTLILLTFGCDNNDSNPAENNLQNGKTISGISGNIINWVHGTSYIAKYGMFSSSAIDINGNFSITDLFAPYDNQLSNITYLYHDYTTQPALSDQSANYFLVTDLGIAKATDPQNEVGFVQNRSQISLDRVGDFYVKYLYVDRPVSINGMTAHSYYSGATLINLKEKYSNITFEKGWNKFVVVLTAIDVTTNTYISEIKREEPSQGNWYYTIY
jgi:uncharacterized lipoprotein NlpE involved in copper resistance